MRIQTLGHIRIPHTGMTGPTIITMLIGFILSAAATKSSLVKT